jgi:Ca2+-binding EF-hand superfamily protein
MVSSIGSVGGMSSTYISQMQERVIKRVDANSDGSVSKDEFVSNRPENVSEDQANKLWSELDTSNAGSLTTSEFVSAMASVGPPLGPPPEGLGKHDETSASSSSDGSLSASTSSSIAAATSELLQALLAALENYASTMEQDDSTSSDAVQGLSDLFGKIDTDGDGSVSQAEFVSNRPQGVSEDQAKAMWSELDTSASGSLTEEQFVSAMTSVGPPPGPPPGIFGDLGGSSASSPIEGSSSVSTSSSTATATSELLQAVLAAIQSYTSTMNQNSWSSAGTSTLASSLSAVA